uniref:NACHT domain-containing protein n=1 Tax=Cyprinus carpio TaxID=7962 RepID=A0A8C1RFL7_CYPCA
MLYVMCFCISSKQQRSASPAPSSMSMKSDWSIDHPLNFKDEGILPEHKSRKRSRSVSPVPSHLTMKSNWSIDHPLNFKDAKIQPRDSGTSKPAYSGNNSTSKPGNSGTSKPGSSIVHGKFKSNLKEKFQCLCEGIAKQGNPTLLNEIYTELYITEGGDGEVNDEHEIRLIETAFRKREKADTPINCNDIFKPLPGQDKPIRTVLTKGVAGIGKTVSVQKFILDWAEGKANNDIQLIFPLPFRELNFMKNQKLSLVELLHIFFMETNEMEIHNDKYKVCLIFDGLDECRLSLDFQNNMRLCDVSESASVDVLLTNLIVGNLLPSALIWITSRPATADLIPSKCIHRVTEVRGFNDPQKEEYFRKRISDQSVANRIISHLKSSRSLFIMCHIPVFCWISATVLEKMLCQAESGEIPKTLTQMYTHFLIIQASIKNQKDYEMNLKDEDMIVKLGKLAFQQLVKGNLIFYEEDLRECSIDVKEASVYSGVCTQIFREELGLYQGAVYCFVHLSIQEHLAALYVFLSFMNHKTNMLDSISKQTMFSDASISISDLLQDAVDKALQSQNGHLDLFLRFLLGLSLESNHRLLQGLLKQTTRGCSHDKQKIVEYVKKKVMDNPTPEKSINLFHCLNELDDHSLVEDIQQYLKSGTIREPKLSPSQWSAVAFVLLTSERELDVFDLSEYDAGTYSTSEEVLLRLLPVIEASRIALFYYCQLTERSCECLASALGSKSSNLRELNLNGNNIQDSGVNLLSAGLKSSHCKLETLRLGNCQLTHKSCEALASALSSVSSRLRELNLSYNNLQDTGVKKLSFGLGNPHCKLVILRLWRCGLTDEGCTALASALRSNPSHLRNLALDRNKLGYSGIKMLSGLLENPQNNLDTLSLIGCDVSERGCFVLASTFKVKSSHLKVLDLYGNSLGDSGVWHLATGLENPNCKIETLRLMYCEMTNVSCTSLALVLKLSASLLRELDLSGNKLGDAGLQILSAGLAHSHCKIETLKLSNCDVTDKGCADLASSLKSNPSHLRELNLDRNELGDRGIKLLSAALENPLCKLQTLKLWECGITDDGCAVLASALRSNPSNLRDLYLFGNKLRDSGVKLLSVLKDDPCYKLENFDLY